jgi:hypothetical protein
MVALMRKKDIPGAQRVMRTHIQSGKQGWLMSFTRQREIEGLSIPAI